MYIYSNYKGGYLVNNQTKETDDACNKPTVGERLRYCREEEGFSIEEVAAYLRCDPQKLINYECNSEPVSYKDMVLLTCLYFHSMEYFCAPFLKDYLAKKGVGSLILRYARYTDKFYHAGMYFPSEDEYEAIVTVVGYNTCPIEPCHHKKGSDNDIF